jgi:hypothetical protein
MFISFFYTISSIHSVQVKYLCRLIKVTTLRQSLSGLPFDNECKISDIHMIL